MTGGVELVVAGLRFGVTKDGVQVTPETESASRTVCVSWSDWDRLQQHLEMERSHVLEENDA